LVKPRISIVLPVFNGARELPETVESLLSQSVGDFELIVVDDGSTDDTPTILADYATHDSRVRVLRQDNGGLTRALIRGCEAACAPLIARQDCGDLSLPGRLERMLDLFAARPSCVVASGECEFVGPAGELLSTTNHASKDLSSAFLHAGIRDLVSLPAGAAAVMRAAAYRQAGGYRHEFYFAQDVDLWIRMAALGDICVDDRVLYRVRIDAETISSVYRAEQVASAGLAIALRNATTQAEREALLGEARNIRPTRRPVTRRAKANAHYFVASCLHLRRDERWRSYAKRAVATHPLHVRSWLLLLRGAIS
jgi:glycosyltransferase involved in cell wall biosynthesis